MSLIQAVVFTGAGLGLKRLGEWMGEAEKIKPLEFSKNTGLQEDLKQLNRYYLDNQQALQYAENELNQQLQERNMQKEDFLKTESGKKYQNLQNQILQAKQQTFKNFANKWSYDQKKILQFMDERDNKQLILDNLEHFKNTGKLRHDINMDNYLTKQRQQLKQLLGDKYSQAGITSIVQGELVEQIQQALKRNIAEGTTQLQKQLKKYVNKSEQKKILQLLIDQFEPSITRQIAEGRLHEFNRLVDDHINKFLGRDDIKEILKDLSEGLTTVDKIAQKVTELYNGIIKDNIKKIDVLREYGLGDNSIIDKIVDKLSLTTQNIARQSQIFSIYSEMQNKINTFKEDMEILDDPTHKYYEEVKQKWQQRLYNKDILQAEIDELNQDIKYKTRYLRNWIDKLPEQYEKNIDGLIKYNHSQITKKAGQDQKKYGTQGVQGKGAFQDELFEYNYLFNDPQLRANIDGEFKPANKIRFYIKSFVNNIAYELGNVDYESLMKEVKTQYQKNKDKSKILRDHINNDMLNRYIFDNIDNIRKGQYTYLDNDIINSYLMKKIETADDLIKNEGNYLLLFNKDQNALRNAIQQENIFWRNDAKKIWGDMKVNPNPTQEDIRNVKQEHDKIKDYRRQIADVYQQFTNTNQNIVRDLEQNWLNIAQTQNDLRELTNAIENNQQYINRYNFNDRERQQLIDDYNLQQQMRDRGITINDYNMLRELRERRQQLQQNNIQLPEDQATRLNRLEQQFQGLSTNHLEQYYNDYTKAFREQRGVIRNVDDFNRFLDEYTNRYEQLQQDQQQYAQLEQDMQQYRQQEQQLREEFTNIQRLRTRYHQLYDQLNKTIEDLRNDPTNNYIIVNSGLNRDQLNAYYTLRDMQNRNEIQEKQFRKLQSQYDEAQRNRNEVIQRLLVQNYQQELPKIEGNRDTIDNKDNNRALRNLQRIYPKGVQQEQLLEREYAMELNKDYINALENYFKDAEFSFITDETKTIDQIIKDYNDKYYQLLQENIPRYRLHEGDNQQKLQGTSIIQILTQKQRDNFQKMLVNIEETLPNSPRLRRMSKTFDEQLFNDVENAGGIRQFVKQLSKQESDIRNKPINRESINEYNNLIQKTENATKGRKYVNMQLPQYTGELDTYVQGLNIPQKQKDMVLSNLAKELNAQNYYVPEFRKGLKSFRLRDEDLSKRVLNYLNKLINGDVYYRDDINSKDLYKDLTKKTIDQQEEIIEKIIKDDILFALDVDKLEDNQYTKALKKFYDKFFKQSQQMINKVPKEVTTTLKNIFKNINNKKTQNDIILL